MSCYKYLKLFQTRTCVHPIIVVKIYLFIFKFEYYKYILTMMKYKNVNNIHITILHSQQLLLF